MPLSASNMPLKPNTAARPSVKNTAYLKVIEKNCVDAVKGLATSIENLVSAFGSRVDTVGIRVFGLERAATASTMQRYSERSSAC